MAEFSPWRQAAQALLGTFVNLAGEGDAEAVGRVIGFDDVEETFLVDAAVSVLTLSESDLLALRAPTEDPRPRKAPAAPTFFGPLPWAPDGRGHFDPASPEEECAVRLINKALPRPLAERRPCVVPPGAVVDDQGRSLLPPEAHGATFLSASALSELATLKIWRQKAAQFVDRSAAAAGAKAAGLKPLHSMTVGPLRALFRARGLVATAGARAPELANELVRYAVLQRGQGLVADEELEGLIKLGDTLALPASYKPPVSLPDLTSYVVSLEVLNQQRTAAAAGLYYAPLEGNPFQIIDPDHVHHNFMTKVIHGQGGVDLGSCAVSIVHLIAAANALVPRDEVLDRILAGGSDKHSHACSLLVTIHPELRASLRTLGHDQDAVILEAIGLCWRAWKERGLTMAIRLEYLSRLQLVVYRIFGAKNLMDSTVLRSQHLAGTPTNQWLDLLAGADVFMSIVASLSPDELKAFNASSLTTRGIESGHSHLMSNTCSGEKMTMEQVRGKVRRMDSLHAMMRIENGPYTYQTSSRKRKLDEDTSASWSDGSSNFAAFFKDVWKRAKGYCGNRATIRDVNAGHGGQ